jgi:hypothetical protein
MGVMRNQIEGRRMITQYDVGFEIHTPVTTETAAFRDCNAV